MSDLEHCWCCNGTGQMGLDRGQYTEYVGCIYCKGTGDFQERRKRVRRSSDQRAVDLIAAGDALSTARFQQMAGARQAWQEVKDRALRDGTAIVADASPRTDALSTGDALSVADQTKEDQ